MEIWFYQLGRKPLEEALPALIEKGLGRGWRVAVQTVDDLRVKALDDLLWTYAPESFLPHGVAGQPGAERQPILITRDADNANGAAMRLFVEGAEIALDPETAYERVILLFDGRNEIELEAARLQWSRLKRAGDTALAYWRQSDDGRWERQS